MPLKLAVSVNDVLMIPESQNTWPESIWSSERPNFSLVISHMCWTASRKTSGWHLWL